MIGTSILKHTKNSISLSQFTNTIVNLWFLFPENTNTHYVFHLSLIFIKACYVRSIALPNLSSIILPIISHRFHFHMFHNISLVTCLINDITLLAIVVEQENVNCNNVFFLSFFQKLFYKQLSKLECTQCQQRIPWSALLSPEASPWWVLQSRSIKL